MSARLCFLLALVAAATLGPACLPWVKETSEETITRAAAPALVVQIVRGSLTIQEHLGTEIEVEVRRSARAPSREAARAALEALLVEFERGADSGNLVVRGRVATAGAFRPWEELDLTLQIRVPAGTAVDARTASGRIELRGLTGVIRATSASGRIFASGLRPPPGSNEHPIRLRTADGNIRGENIEGSIRAETGDGRIRLLGRLQQVDAVSADGRIEVVVHEGGAAANGEWMLRTANGRVRLTLPQSTNALVSAVGTISSDDEDEVPAWKEEGPIAFATLGDGSGPRIRLLTADGSVGLRINPRD